VTAPRGKIEASLAGRGRPAMWANEQEAAVLSGYPADGVNFRAALPELESQGFPKISSWNNRRFIPGIEDFWRRQLDAIAAPMTELQSTNARDYEDDPHHDTSQRRSSGY